MMGFPSFRSLIRLPRDPETRTEALVLGMLMAMFLIFVSGAVHYATREHRDGLRRQQLREIKTELEHWYNSQNGFPLHPSGELGWCGSTEDPDDWFFVSFLQRERRWPTPVRDPRPSRRFVLRYCPTALAAEQNADIPLTGGFFLEAVLENPAPDSAQFNTEHNVFERTFTVNGRTQYRLCGGIETQCGTEKPE